MIMADKYKFVRNAGDHRYVSMEFKNDNVGLATDQDFASILDGDNTVKNAMEEAYANTET